MCRHSLRLSPFLVKKISLKFIALLHLPALIHCLSDTPLVVYKLDKKNYLVAEPIRY
ncbi:hypothetical protein CKO_01511 [Citrobacter koseri ATCC BAA-895]|uniref:Uncharacterized protein n=1 Tax=Citrobacter koseri (strain ATCC BAA-895 / CDC 4225-83 / SGSC4696) TaxID=290338 RepID=A8AGN2_CITK8|nr:hypothetical protein CKO_01511 [Citrobacter koseri ATCC BAA-895]